ncbi:MAG TPA: radical SAM protein [Bacteroidales bacterium]|nr:radical SAM protein [Bacteroidales bacterium]
MLRCNICPQQCNADRTLANGWCGSDDRIHVASLVIHKGEEPPISGEKGIVNLFFPSCNMQCIYCQNHEISQKGTQGTVMSLDEVCDAIAELLPLSEGNLGFVSPTHFVPQMVMIVKELRRRGHNPVIVYNTNGYDLPETIRSLEGIVDVWLPDFKYSDDRLAVEYSAAPGYSVYAVSALKEMVHQCGVTLHTDERGIARRGVIVRHLVLPGAVDNSLGVLKTIAEEVSPNLHISLMSQYYPPKGNFLLSPFSFLLKESHDRKSHISYRKSLLRPIIRKEYETVIYTFHSLGFTHGWLQDYDSPLSYQPDFSKEDPFNSLRDK